MKNNNVKKVLSLIPRKIYIDLFFVILCCGIMVLTVLEPIIISDLIESASNQKFSLLYRLIVVVLLVYISRVTLGYYKNQSLIRYRNECVLSISTSMVSYLLRMKKRHLKEWTPAYVVSRVVDEVAELDGILPRFLIDGILNIIICIVIFILMFKYSCLIGIITLIFVVGDYFLQFCLPLKKVFKRHNDFLANLKRKTTDLFQGITQVKMGECIEKESKLYNKDKANYLDALYQKRYFSQIQRTASNVFKQLGYLVVIVISSFLIASNKISLGQFTMLLSLYNLLWGHTAASANLVPLYRYGSAACDRIMEVFSLEIESGESCSLTEAVIESIYFDNIVFGYDSDKPILNGMSFSAKRGKIISLAGYSGCGKSTALNILLGFIKKSAGNIRVNNKEVTDKNLVSLRPKMAYVGQSNFLFNRSIRENLLYYAEYNENDEKKLEEYLKLFELNKLIESFSDGLDHIIDANSINISGGECQRLCIIRELMKHPDILILDECTSHLDAESEKKVFEVIKQLAATMIVIQVAHRPSALSYSDCIYVLEDGHVLTCGTHTELCQSSSFYQKLIISMRNNTDKFNNQNEIKNIVEVN